MAVQKNRRSKAKVGDNNAHSALKKSVIASNEFGKHISHRATVNEQGDFVYKGKVVVMSRRNKKNKQESGK